MRGVWRLRRAKECKGRPPPALLCSSNFNMASPPGIVDCTKASMAKWRAVRSFAFLSAFNLPSFARDPHCPEKYSPLHCVACTFTSAPASSNNFTPGKHPPCHTRGVPLSSVPVLTFG